MSPGCVTPFDYQAHVARQCARFVDSEAEYDERDAIALLRALRSTAAGARKTWFVDVRACRRRQQQAAQFASGGGGEARGGLLVRRRRSRRHGVPAALESLFNAPDEFALLEQAALLRRARTQLARRGLSARDAFALFNKSRSGNVSCRELAAGLGWLGMKLSVPQLHATMRVLDSTGEGELGADDFRAAFGARSDDDEEAGSAARAGAASAPPLVDALGGGGGGGGGGLTAAQGLGAPSGGLMGGGMVGLGMGGGLEEVQKTIKDTPHVPELGPLGGGGGRGGADAAGGGAAGGGAVDLRGFEVRVRKAKDFAEVWTAGAQTGPAGSGWSEPVSVWAPAADSTGLGKASVRLCVGHYPSREGNPAKARGAGRLIVELASASSTFGLAGLGATERFLEVARGHAAPAPLQAGLEHARGGQAALRLAAHRALGRVRRARLRRHDVGGGAGAELRTLRAGCVVRRDARAGARRRRGGRRRQRLAAGLAVAGLQGGAALRDLGAHAADGHRLRPARGHLPPRQLPARRAPLATAELPAAAGCVRPGPVRRRLRI
jgi:hypothetical protein